MKKIATLACLLVLVASITACSHKTIDVDAPCPDYGRYCPQTPIN